MLLPSGGSASVFLFSALLHSLSQRPFLSLSCRPSFLLRVDRPCLRGPSLLFALLILSLLRWRSFFHCGFSILQGGMYSFFQLFPTLSWRCIFFCCTSISIFFAPVLPSSPSAALILNSASMLATGIRRAGGWEALVRGWARVLRGGGRGVCMYVMRLYSRERLDSHFRRHH